MTYIHLSLSPAFLRRWFILILPVRKPKLKEIRSLAQSWTPWALKPSQAFLLPTVAQSSVLPYSNVGPTSTVVSHTLLLWVQSSSLTLGLFFCPTWGLVWRISGPFWDWPLPTILWAPACETYYSLSFCSRYTFGKPVSGTLTVNMTVNGVGYYSQEVGRPILRTTKVRSRNLELSPSGSLPTEPALGFSSVITHFILLSRTVCMVGIFLMIKFLQAERRG